MKPTPHPSGLSQTTIADLTERARVVAANAFAPYSNFRVGAAVLLEQPTSGIPVVGCNVENMSYRLTTCAEQAAIVAAVAKYGQGVRIRAVSIANLNDSASAPCGACRQMIYEFSMEKTWIFFPGERGAILESPLSELLPFAFRLDLPTRNQ